VSIANVPSVTFDVVCKGLAKFGDISYSIAFVCTTPAEKNNSKCAFFFDTAGGTYTCCSVQFDSQSVTIRSKKKKQSACHVILQSPPFTRYNHYSIFPGKRRVCSAVCMYTKKAACSAGHAIDHFL
jgi:hypothetical protein